MANLVIAAAGAVVGGMIGGPAGARWGWAIGSALGSAFTKGKTQYNTQQVMSDLRVFGTEYGQPIPHIRGSRLTAGQFWWNTDRRPITSVTTESAGKGGGQKTVTTTITYEMDVLIGLTRNEIAGIAKIFDNGKLIWNATDGATISTINASGATERWARMTVYTGSDTQLPDPTYEAAVGVGNAPAYRGRAYVFIEGLKLGQSGTVPNLTFEVVADGFLQYTQGPFTDSGFPDIGDPTFGIDFYDDNIVMGTANTGACYARSHDGGNSWTPFDVDEACTGLAGGTGPGDVHRILTISGDVDLNPGKLYYSDNFGVTWEYVMDCNGFGNLVYLNGRWLMFSTTHCKSSVDGESWDTVAMPATATWTLATYCELTSQYLVGTLTGSAGFQIAKSGDLSAWSLVATPTTPESVWPIRQLACDAAGLVIAGCSGLSQPNTLQSLDGGDTWAATLVTTDAPGTWRMNTLTFTHASGFWSFLDSTGKIIVTRDWSEFTRWLTPTYNDTPRIVQFVGGRLWFAQDHAPTLQYSDLATIQTITKTPPSVQEVQEEICLLSGLDASQFDVSALASITRDVDSLAWGAGSARSITEEMMASYFYEVTMSDKLYFRPRGTSSVATIPYADLGASMGEQVEPFALKQINDLEIPAQIALTFVNISNDYQTAIEYSDRLISATDGTVEAVTLSLGFTPSAAKSIADVMLLDRVAGRFSAPISLLGDYARLEPTDPVTILDNAGSSFRMRLVQKNDTFPLLKYEAVLDDTSILSSQGITSTDYESQTEVASPPDTVLALMDIPILQDGDNDGGFYVASKGSDTPYPGSVIFKSADDVTFAQEIAIDESAVMGTCTTTLGDWTGPRLFDETNSVTVDVGDGELASTTRATLLSSQAVNAMLIGAEIIQFRTATLSAPGIYVLTGLLRGGRGTEWAMVDHEASERCVLLRAAGVRRIVLSNVELGVAKYYKGVTRGRALSSADSEAFTCNAVGLKPFSPVDLRAARDGSDNITFTWRRRTRMSCRHFGALGTSIPLGEGSERYEIDIYDGADVVRTINATSETATYSAAEQAADGLTPGDPVACVVYQLSETVGRGYELEETV